MADEGEKARFEKVEKDIRAVLQSSKGGVELHRVDKDFRLYCDKNGIPYRQFGFTGVQDMLAKMPNTCKMTRSATGVIMVHAVATAETMHVAKLVGGQKTKKKRKNIPRETKSMSYGRRTASSYSSRPPPINNYSRTHITPRKSGISQYNQYQQPNQQQRRYFNSTSTNVYAIPSQRNFNVSSTGSVPIPPKSLPAVTPPSNVPNVNITDALLKDRIAQLVTNVHGMHSTRLPKLYEDKFKERAPGNIADVAANQMKGRIVVERPYENQILLYPLMKASQQATSNQNGQAVKPTNAPVTPIVNRPQVKVDYTSEPLPLVGESLVVGVVHIISLDSFFVQVVDSPLVDLAPKLQAFYQNSTPQHNSKYKIGDCCAALFKDDNQWYRAKVLSLRPDSDTSKPQSPNDPACRVLFVDYGNQEKVSLDQMRPLASQFFDLPTQAIQCGLDGVLPLNRSKHDKEAIDHFHTLVLEQESVIEVKEHIGSLLRVTLQINGENISIRLIKDKVVHGSPDYTKEMTGTPGDSQSDSDSLVSENVSVVTSPFANRLNSLSFEEATADEGRYVEVPAVEDTNEDYVDVFVTNINSTADFQFILQRQTHSVAMQSMEKKMFKHYTSNNDSYKVDSVTIGDYYAALGLDNHLCYRVVVRSIDGDQCTVELLDKGTELNMEVSDLRQLHSSFIRLPFQQISASLQGITDSLDVDILSAFHDLAYSKILVAHIVERPNKINGEKCIVELFKDDTNINEELAARQTSVDDLKPSLPKPSTTKEVFLSHITDDGVFYIRCPGPGMLRSDQMMDEILEYFTANPAKASDFVSKPQPGDLVWARYRRDGIWYRALIKDIDRVNREASIHFVDYGNDDTIKTTCLRKPINASQMNAIPHQAIKCRLADWPKSLEHVWNEEFGTVLIDRLDDAQLEVEVVSSKASDDGLPLVKFYHTTPEKGRILYTSELFEFLEKDGTISGAVRSLGDDIAIKNGSHGAQMSSDASHVTNQLFLNGDWLDVLIAHVSSPGYFSVHLYASFAELEKLKSNMAAYYDNVADEEHFPMPSVGAECAVYDLDGETWCRAVIQEITNNKVTVFYSDWAMSKVTTLSNLRVLQPQFKELPYQGIICSLSGVVSKTSSEWPSRAVRRFVELISGECAFVMKINKINYSTEQLPFHMKLVEVDFYDTRSARDVCLNDVLIDEGYANRTA